MRPTVTPSTCGGDELGAGREVVGLAVDLGAGDRVEQVDLAIDGQRRAGRIEQHAGVGEAAGAVADLVDRAGQHVDAELGGQPGQHRVARAVDGLGGGGQRGVAALVGPGLGQHDEARAGGGGAADQLRRRRHVGGLVGARVELHAGDPHDAAPAGAPARSALAQAISVRIS